ncbi:MAG: ATP-binding protein, partial [Chloroflexi bacterium]|nr:ATP-binding protein [Chloroflexota bacterium]
LSNAGKYGPDGPCEVNVLADRDGDDIVVQVLDDGTNFPTADRHHLFDLFFRASAPARLKPGAGIGLYVTRILVEAMDGRVWAAEREGGGSAFGFTLPILTVAGEPESA